MTADEPVQLRYLRDILGKYFRKVLGWHGPIGPTVPTVTVERHRTDDPDITRYVAMDDKGIAASIRDHVVHPSK